MGKKSKFGKELDLEGKTKTRYYSKEFINLDLEDHKYICVLTSSKKKINIIAKILKLVFKT